ncbi:MAG TPA: homoserine kinase [Ktedonobacterales bacterium]|nr:homoserine kinase [Ktedonobacterales bacterium]
MSQPARVRRPSRAPFVRAFAPATVANVISGFDIFGFAVEAPGDEVTAHYKESPGVGIARITGDGGKLPRASGANTASVAARALLESLGARHGVTLEVHKRMPLGSGLGSSAASAVAAVVAVNALLGEPLSRRELLPFALEGERVSCGGETTHADNVAPALLGGFILIRGYDPLDVVSLPAPARLWCALVHPDLVVSTRDARAALPEMVPLRQAVVQWGAAAGLVAGLFLDDEALIARSLCDVIVEPVRAPLIPGYADVRQAALEAGALGCGISGAAPSMFALTTARAAAEAAGKAMAAAFERAGLRATVYVSPINRAGARVLEARPILAAVKE